MPNIKSAAKRMKQSEDRRLRNRMRRSEMRSMIKQFRGLIASEKLDEARALLPSVYSAIDKRSRKGVIHANTAARYKSRLTKSLKEAAAS